MFNTSVKDENARPKDHSRESNRTVSTNDFSQGSSTHTNTKNMFFEFEHERKLTMQLQDDHDVHKENDIPQIEQFND